MRIDKQKELECSGVQKHIEWYSSPFLGVLLVEGNLLVGKVSSRSSEGIEKWIIEQLQNGNSVQIGVAFHIHRKVRRFETTAEKTAKILVVLLVHFFSRQFYFFSKY